MTHQKLILNRMKFFTIHLHTPRSNNSLTRSYEFGHYTLVYYKIHFVSLGLRRRHWTSFNGILSINKFRGSWLALLNLCSMVIKTCMNCSIKIHGFVIIKKGEIVRTRSISYIRPWDFDDNFTCYLREQLYTLMVSSSV